MVPSLHIPFQVLRDGQWQEDDAAILVPGDIISIKLGDIIPADARLLEGDPLKIDQASLNLLDGNEEKLCYKFLLINVFTIYFFHDINCI